MEPSQLALRPQTVRLWTVGYRLRIVSYPCSHRFLSRALDLGLETSKSKCSFSEHYCFRISMHKNNRYDDMGCCFKIWRFLRKVCTALVQAVLLPTSGVATEEPSNVQYVLWSRTAGGHEILTMNPKTPKKGELQR